MRTGVVHSVSPKKDYVYIYGDKLLFINITIGEKSQQGNVTPTCVCHTCDPFGVVQVIHSLGKVFSQLPPHLQGMIQF